MTKVITYGTYDLFHQGHYNLLKHAKELGDYLIVGVTTEHFDEARGKINVVDDVLTRVQHVRETGFADQIIIEDHEGQKISFDVPIIADIREKDASQRLITERFTLKSGKYNSSQDYYLILADMDDESQVVQKYKFTIDIAEM